MAGPLKLNQDFKEFLESLNANDVRYLIIGGYAVAFHGYPRYTKDLDIWLWIAPQNAANMVKALDQFGFSSLGLKLEDFLEPDTIIQLGYPPQRIDLVTHVTQSQVAERVPIVVFAVPEKRPAKPKNTIELSVGSDSCWFAPSTTRF